MTTAVDEILHSFDALSDDEQHEVAVEVLRCTARAQERNRTDEALLSLADKLFQDLDAREAADARPASP